MIGQELKEKFDAIKYIDAYQRVDPYHVSDFYIGKDAYNRPVLLLLTDIEPPSVVPSSIIDVDVGLRHDSRWAFSLILLNNSYEDLFYRLCLDIIDSSRYVVKEEGARHMAERYEKWQNMMAKHNNGLLSPNAVKGLIGELVFLTSFLYEKYGVEIAVQSWIGPDMAYQDFVCPDLWYEVKAITSGAEVVKISSLEQLDQESKGELVVVHLDKTSATDKSAITLNQIYQVALEGIKEKSLKETLTDTLLKLGYFPRREYDDFVFSLNSIDRYQVEQDFPALRKCDIPASIVNCKYLLSLAIIKPFRKE